MDKEELQRYIIAGDCTIIEAMKRMDSGAKGILFVTDQRQKLCGSLTDGDIRRWIIRTADLSGTVDRMMNRNPIYLFEEDTADRAELLKRHSIRSFPILDDKREIQDIYFAAASGRKRAREKELSELSVIVMAGGKGTRLYPYTKILPKPLIPVGDIPILERILDKFHQAGAKKFYLVVNYKKEMIKSYFAEQKPPYGIHYVEEDVPLGTAGGVRLIDEELDSPVLITNCDTLIEMDYGKLIEHHKGSGNEMTVVSALKNTVIPYGVLHSKEEGIVTSIEEKPKLSYIVNTGMYVVNSEVLKWIPENRIFHMTDLVQLIMDQGRRVGMYPISDNSFLDMGEFEEMKKMEERLNNGYAE